METKVSIVIMSHLSDLQEFGHTMTEEERQIRFNFVKYLVMNYSNTEVYFDPNEVYKEFLIKRGYKS